MNAIDNFIVQPAPGGLAHINGNGHLYADRMSTDHSRSTLRTNGHATHPEPTPAPNPLVTNGYTAGLTKGLTNGHSKATPTPIPTPLPPVPKACWATLLTQPSYLAGVLVLADSLRHTSPPSQYPLLVLLSHTLPPIVPHILKSLSIPTVPIAPYPPPSQGSNPAFKRFDETWSKLRAFEMEGWDRVVFMDCDMIVRRNMDELMRIELPDWEAGTDGAKEGWKGIAAAHVCACNPRELSHYPVDWIPANCPHTACDHPTVLTSPPQPTIFSPRPWSQLNSGLVVLRPSLSQARALAHLASTSPLVQKFQFPDQDLLAHFFAGRWIALPYIYNALKTLSHMHKQEWREEEVRCIHYILDKPWDGRGREEEKYRALHELWWEAWGDVRKEMLEKCGEEELKFVEKYVKEA